MIRYGRRHVLRLLASSGAVVGGLKPVKADVRNPEVRLAQMKTPGLPEGYRRPGDMRWGWGPETDGILPDWKGGSGTLFDPRLVLWNADGSATLRFERDDQNWVAGELQVNRPRRHISERWGAILSSERPHAVCAFFAYAADGTEIDFEWRGDQVWQMNLHLFDENGERVNPSPLPTFQADITALHRYEFAMTDRDCSWFVDGEEVARVVPSDMPRGQWKPDANFELFCAIEHHGAWAKHDYTDLPAAMQVHGLLV